MSATVPLPLANDPAARTETGELKDQAAAPLTEAKVEPKTTETTVETTADTKDRKSSSETTKSTEPKPDPSLLTKEDDKPAGAPEKYEPFAVPEGYELNTEVAKEAEGIFKDMGLNQAQAQKLVDFYSSQVRSVAEAPQIAFTEMNKQWADATMADPELGPHIGKVKETISRAMDALGDAKLTAEFKSVMDLTGAGNHPAFVKAFYKLASAVTEGRHVGGTGPSKLGQLAPGAKDRPSTASALYPNLG